MADLPEDYDSEDLFDWRDAHGLMDLDPYPGMNEWDAPLPPPELPSNHCSICGLEGQLIAVGRLSRLKLQEVYRCQPDKHNWRVRVRLPPMALRRYLNRELE